jgi:TrmH family RNA methyltransferase
LRGLPEQCVVSESALHNPEVMDIVGQLESRHGHVLALPDALYNAVSQVEHGVGVMFLIDTPERAVTAPMSVSAVLLDGVQDPGNVGSILRSAAAAGIKQVYCSAGTAFCWSPKVLRAAMGAHFVLDIFENVDLAALVSHPRSPRWRPAATPPGACTMSTCASRWRGCLATKGRAWRTICCRWPHIRL